MTAVQEVTVNTGKESPFQHFHKGIFSNRQQRFLEARSISGTTLITTLFHLCPAKHAYILASLKPFVLLLTELFITHILQHQLQNSTKILGFNNWHYNPLCTHRIWTLVSIPERTLKEQNPAEQRLFTWLISLRDQKLHLEWI